MEIIITSIAMISVSNILITKPAKPAKYLNLYRFNILIDNYKNGYGISFKEGYPY